MAPWTRERAIRSAPALADAPLALVAAAFVLLHLGATLAGYAFYLTPQSVSAFWAASGVLFAALTVTPTRAWLLLVPLSVACELLALPLLRAPGPIGFVGGASQVEALVGASLVRFAVGPRPDLSRTSDLLRFVGLAVVLGPAIGALAGAALFVHYQPQVTFAAAWQVWWCADSLGVLVAAPALLAWTTDSRPPPRAARLEAAAALLVLVAAAAFVLGGPATPYRSLLDFPYVVFPVLLWIAFRLETRAVTAAALLLAVSTVAYADRGRGPFVLTAGATVQANTLAIQAFLATIALSALLIHAAVTDRRRALEQRLRIQRSVQQLERLEVVGRLAGAVAHDFNNDLTVILSCADILAQSELPEGAPRRAAAEIARAGERSSAMVQQLLAIGGRQEHRRARLDVDALVRDLEPTLQRVLGDRIALTTSYAARGAVDADRAQLEQALLNLVINARDALPADGEVTLATRDTVLHEAPRPDVAPGAFVVIEVADDGSGIPPDVLEHVFDPFFTTKPAGRGTGLGLTSVYGIVRQHGGWLDVRTEVGAGTAFAIHLPRAGEARTGAPVTP